MNVLDPTAVVQDFDLWHLAMEGAEAHEQMRQRRLNAQLDRQIDLASRTAEMIEQLDPADRDELLRRLGLRPPLPPMRIDADGYFRPPLDVTEPHVFDPAGFR